MTRRLVSWRGFWAAAALLALAFVTVGSAADDDDKGKGKGGAGAKGKGSNVVQVDLSKLPPDLAKQLMKYIRGPGKMDAAQGKGGELRLPPGLARKPPSHPGRVNWLRAHGLTERDVAAKKGKMPPTQFKGKPKAKKGKKGGEEDDD
jgi:hypothetical protein